MHRQLSSVMCMASTTNASVLIVCCRRHCESLAARMHTLTVRVKCMYVSVIPVGSHYCYQCGGFLDEQTEGSVAFVYRNTHRHLVSISGAQQQTSPG